jgi:hypothetical protein
MTKTLLQSRITHKETKKPYVLLKQEGNKYYIDVLEYKGNKYEPKRKSGIYSDIEYFKTYDEADTSFIQSCLGYN